MTVSKSLVAPALIVGALSVPAIGLAGYKGRSEVTIYAYSGGKSVWGNLRDIRDSDDTTQYLYCVVQSTRDGSSGTCWATDRSGQSAMCTTTLPEHIQTLRGIGDASNVAFTVRDGSSNCDTIFVYHGSM